MKVNLQKGSPFKPFDQLMAVLPPRRYFQAWFLCLRFSFYYFTNLANGEIDVNSAHALPRAYEALMKSEDLIYFYPYGKPILCQITMML